MHSSNLHDLYQELMDRWGPRGWWPLLETGYHMGDYSYPRNPQQRFEIGLGAILTQNTAWTNASRAIEALAAEDLIHPEALLDTEPERIEELIRPSGYWRAKTRKLREYARFVARAGSCIPTRQDLLSVWGIGPETADDILLYAWQQPVFVVDTYTKRLFLSRGLIEETATYHEIQDLCHRELPATVPLLQEFHALIVQWGKAKPK